MIVVFDSISSLLIVAIIILLSIRMFRERNRTTAALILSFLFLFFSTIFNLPEHLVENSTFVIIEVFFEVIFIPTLILAINNFIIAKELKIRRESEQKFKGMINQSYSLIGLVNKDGVLIECNNTAIDFIGRKKEELLGKLFWDTPWWSHSKEEQKQLQNALNESKKGKLTRFETYHIDRNNKKHIIDFSIKLISDEEDKPMFYIVEGRDITILKGIQTELKSHKENLELLVIEKTHDLETANEELQATNEELYDKSEIIKDQNQELKSTLQHLKETQAQLLQSEKMASLGILTAGVAHEINNPLNYIMGSYVGLLRHYNENTFSDNPEQVGKLIEAMKIGLDRSSAIVQGLNQFSRKSDSYDEDCNVHEIIENSLTMLHNQIKHKISVEKEYCNSDIVIKGNVGLLHQVFMNILGNAVQSIESEGEITIKTEDKESDVLIAITDTGVGIPEENLKKITDPFFTTKAPGKGTGLGLSITYNIIKEHKGKLKFDSQEGKGTTVTVILAKPINHEQEGENYIC